jgi:hypothetical protein
MEDDNPPNGGQAQGSTITATGPESFRAVLRQASASDDENILVHRIGGTAETEGEDPADALLRFLDSPGNRRCWDFMRLSTKSC